MNKFKILPFLAVFLVNISCSTETAMQHILGTSVQAPVFLECRAISASEVLFRFSQPVSVTSVNFSPALNVSVINEGMEVIVEFSDPPAGGIRITADMLVEDSDRNTLNVIVPFRSRNDRMPKIIFNELRFDYSNPRVEFIEFLVLEGGNLGAMRLFIAHQSMTLPFYEFAPIEVKTGERIVLHMRTLNENSIDETGDNLALSAGNEAMDSARDLWVPGNRKYLHTPNGLWLMDQDDQIIDALLLSHSPGTDSSHRTFQAAAEFLGERNAWLPLTGAAEDSWVPDPANAIITTGITATRTLNRDETVPYERRAGSWYVTVTSGHTPGRVNDQRRHN